MWDTLLVFIHVCIPESIISCYRYYVIRCRHSGSQGIGGDPFKESSSLFGQQFQPSPTVALSGDPFAPGNDADDPFLSTLKPAVSGTDPFKGTSDGKDPFTFSGDSFGAITVSVGVMWEGDMCR